MENSEHPCPPRNRAPFASAAYHAAMAAAFVIGLYGLLSLFSLASAEFQHSIVGSLP